MTDSGHDPDPGLAERLRHVTLADLVIRLAVVGFVLYWGFLLVRPFLVLTIWGGILAVALFPVQSWLARCLGGRSAFAASVITLAGLALILGPAGLVGASLIESVQTIGTAIEQNRLRIPLPPPGVAEWPVIGDGLTTIWTAASKNLAGVLETYSDQLKQIGNALIAFSASTGKGVLQFAAAIVIAGVMMHFSATVGTGLEALVRRLSPDRGTRLMELARATIRNVARGVVGIAILQTMIIAIGYLVADFPFAGLLIVVCLVLSLVQVGPGIPVIASIIAAFSIYDTTGAILFTAWMIPAMLVDNILKPVVLSRGLSTPMLVVFIGVIGGTLAHGLIGLFVGPVVLAVCYELLVAWVRGGDQQDVISQVQK